MDRREYEELLRERRSVVRRSWTISIGFWLSAPAAVVLIVVGEFLVGLGLVLIWALVWIAYIEFSRGPKRRHEARLHRWQQSRAQPS